jgi:hypothetical protein
VPSSIPDADAFNWVIGPAAQCVTLVGEETRIASVLQRAIVALAGQGPLLQLARHHLKRTHRPDDSIRRLLADQAGLGDWAKEIIASDYDPINRHGIIGLWVAVEVAVEDTAILILTKDVAASALVAASGVKLPQGSTTPHSEGDARRIYKRLESHSRQGRDVANGYRELLATLEVAISISAEAVATLSELNYVRNCLLHRAGFADERAPQEAPALALQIGMPIKIGSKQYLQYFDAVAEFAQALLKGVIGSRYLRVKL